MLTIHTVKSVRASNNYFRFTLEPHCGGHNVYDEQFVSFESMTYAAERLDTGRIFIGDKRTGTYITSVLVPATLVDNSHLANEIETSILIGMKDMCRKRDEKAIKKLAKYIEEVILCGAYRPIVCSCVKTPFYLTCFSPYSIWL